MFDYDKYIEIRKLVRIANARAWKGTKKISQFHDQEDILVTEYWDKNRFPMLLKITRGQGKQFQEKIEKLLNHCVKNKILFQFTAETSASGQTKCYALIDTFGKNLAVHEIEFYLNGAREAYAFSVVKRRKNINIGSAWPKPIKKKLIQDFHFAADYIMRELEIYNQP